MRKLAIRFFSKTMTTDFAKSKPLDSKVTLALISFAKGNDSDTVQGDADDKELVALLAAYLGTVCKGAAHSMAARGEITVLIGLARK